MADRGGELGSAGAGAPELKAAMDALSGCPPNVFPFGRQYGWADARARRTYSYQVSLDDDNVRRALRAALPVARLHRRIGRLEIVDFDLLTDDRGVQATSFADGTRIVANLAAAPAAVPGLGVLPPHSWREDA